MRKTKYTKIGNAGWPVPLECLVSFKKSIDAQKIKLINQIYQEGAIVAIWDADKQEHHFIQNSAVQELCSLLDSSSS